MRNVPEAVKFYTKVIGFNDMGFAPAFRMGMVSAGGYHHHIGLNSWMGEGAPPTPPGARIPRIPVPGSHRVFRCGRSAQALDENDSGAGGEGLHKAHGRSAG